VDALKSRVSQFSVHTNEKFALTLTLIYYREFIFGIKTRNKDNALRKLYWWLFRYIKLSTITMVY